MLSWRSRAAMLSVTFFVVLFLLTIAVAKAFAS